MEPMPISIRPAGEQDADAIARIVNQASRGRALLGARGPDERHGCPRAHAKGALLVAAEGETAVGCVYVEVRGDHGSIRDAGG